MKKILQTKVFKTLSTCCLCFCSCISLHSFHVENVARVNQTIEAEETEAEFQEEQQPGEEYAVADQVEDQALESDFANPDTQQGKPRCILNLVSLH